MLQQTKGETLFPGSPPPRCDCGCGRSLSDGFVEGKYRATVASFRNAWGYFFPGCYRSVGAGFSKGVGQQWHRTPDGKFALVKLSPEIVMTHRKDLTTSRNLTVARLGAILEQPIPAAIRIIFWNDETIADVFEGDTPRIVREFNKQLQGRADASWTATVEPMAVTS